MTALNHSIGLWFHLLLVIIRLVIETLKEVEKDRKCFRMIGGVLVERTVNEVLPALEQNKDQVELYLDLYMKQVDGDLINFI